VLVGKRAIESVSERFRNYRVQDTQPDGCNQSNSDFTMANNPKTGKKAATKPAKTAGTHKVPKYAQGDVAAAPVAPKPAPKGGK
jgi:hypothetical protein